MAAGYSGTPLAKKLGIKAGQRVCLLAAPPGFRKLLEPLPDGVEFTTRSGASCDIVHVFAKSKAKLDDALTSLLKVLRKDAVIWVSWPKKAAKMESDITEDTIRALALPRGLVDIKVCAVDETWSALKLVMRKELRA